jgi:hypothetical protein
MDSSKSELNRLYSTQWDRAKRKIDGELLTQRFFSRAIVRDHTWQPRANEMEATHPLV